MFEQMSCHQLLRKANRSGSWKKVERVTGSVVHNGMGSLVRGEAEPNISEKSSLRQAAHDACPVGQLLSLTPSV